MAAALVNQLAKRLLAVPELGDQPLKSFGFFDRVQVGALDILHQRQFESGGVVQLPDNGRNLVQPRRLCRPPAPFAGDDFIATAAERADENRLKQALPLDRFGQLVQLGSIALAAGLAVVGYDGRMGVTPQPLPPRPPPLQRPPPPPT